MNRRIYLILAVIAIVGVLCCLNVCSAVEDNNNVSIVSSNVDGGYDSSDSSGDISPDSVRMSKDEVNKELDIFCIEKFKGKFIMQNDVITGIRGD